MGKPPPSVYGAWDSEPVLSDPAVVGLEEEAGVSNAVSMQLRKVKFQTLILMKWLVAKNPVMIGNRTDGDNEE